MNRTINVDTGCVFGGRLTALRYPKLTLHAEHAAFTSSPSHRPFLPSGEYAPAVVVGGLSS